MSKSQPLFVVSTVRDTPENIEFFVGRNRAAGVDHFFVFHEDGLRGIDTGRYPFVTFIDARDLHPDEPNLNKRQRANSNCVNQYLAHLGIRGWLLPIDGDEVFHGVKSDLQELDAGVDCVHLPPAEIISLETQGREEARHFKTILDEERLSCCYGLGFISRPDNTEWLRGHTEGKYLARIDAGSTLRIHNIRREGGRENVTSTTIEGMFIKHYDGYNYREFERKFRALSRNPRKFKKSARITAIVDIFRNYGDREDFGSVSRSLYRQWMEETDVARKLDYGFLFELAPAENPSTDISFNERIALAEFMGRHGSTPQPDSGRRGKASLAGRVLAGVRRLGKRYVRGAGSG